MISLIPLAAGILSVLSDDDEPDFDDKFQRAVRFERPEFLIDVLDDDQRERFIENLWAWFREVSKFDLDYEQRKLTFQMFFNELSRHEAPKRLVWVGDEPVEVGEWLPSARRTAIRVLLAPTAEILPDTYTSISRGSRDPQQWKIDLKYSLWSGPDEDWSEFAPRVYEAIYEGIAEGAICEHGETVVVVTAPRKEIRLGTVTFSPSKDEDRVDVNVEFYKEDDDDRRLYERDEFSVASTDSGFREAMKKIDEAEERLNDQEWEDEEDEEDEEEEP
jgi:hypothetical protein